MSDSNLHAENLEYLRNVLVEERRSIAGRARRLASEDTVIRGHLDRIMEIQATIEVIDRIMAEEQALEPSVYETRGIREI